MLIQVNTDNNITGREQLVEEVEGVVRHSLGRFSGQITRVEVHLNDENSHKQGPDDKRCMMEARLEHRPPTAVTHQAENLHAAVTGAADKLKSALDKEIGRLRSH